MRQGIQREVDVIACVEGNRARQLHDRSCCGSSLYEEVGLKVNFPLRAAGAHPRGVLERQSGEVHKGKICRTQKPICSGEQRRSVRKGFASQRGVVDLARGGVEVPLAWRTDHAIPVFDGVRRPEAGPGREYSVGVARLHHRDDVKRRVPGIGSNRRYVTSGGDPVCHASTAGINELETGCDGQIDE